MKLASKDIVAGGRIPRMFTCEGEDVSPELNWSDAPQETLSFVVLCEDPDAPSGIWRHWAAYDIPAGTTSLPRGAGRADAGALEQGVNDFGRRGWGGPCPPRGRGAHRYRFRLLALSTAHVRVRADARCLDIEKEALKHRIAEADLVASFER